MIESGPAAGALAACHYCDVLGIDRLMSFDMGGTTAKACLIENREPLITGLFEVDRRYRFKEGSGLPVTIPSIDMIEIGAGGGSIAHADALGLLKVGPESAGSAPGPACYGRGGTQPTVTDADLVLGLLDADNFLGGDMKLDRAAADRAMAALAARARSFPPSAARGHFPRGHRGDGGGGARARHRPRRRLPRHAAVRLRRRRPRSCLRGREPAAELVGDRAAAAERAVGVRHPGDVAAARSRAQRSRARRRSRLGPRRSAFSASSCAKPPPRSSKPAAATTASSSFSAQTCATSASRASSPSPSTPIRGTHRDAARIVSAFEEAYRKLYGVNPSHVPIELVTWRVTARGPIIPFSRATVLPDTPGHASTSRPVHAWSEGAETPVYDRKSLAAGQTIAGPAIIEERETTTAIPPGWSASIDQVGCIIARKD